MKKFIALGMAILLSLSLTGCSNNAPDAPFYINVGDGKYVYYGMPEEELSALLDGYELNESGIYSFTYDYGDGLLRDDLLVFITVEIEEGLEYSTYFDIKLSDSVESIEEKIGEPPTVSDKFADTYYYTYSDDGTIDFLSEYPSVSMVEKDDYFKYYAFSIGPEDTAKIYFGDLYATSYFS